MLALITPLSLLFDVSGNSSTFNSQFLVPPPTYPQWPVKLVGVKLEHLILENNLNRREKRL